MYTPLPTTSQPSPSPQRRPPRLIRLGSYVLISGLALLVAHFAVLGLLPHDSNYRHRLSAAGLAHPAKQCPQLTCPNVTRPDPGELVTQLSGELRDALEWAPGRIYRDPRPIETALRFWELAEREVMAKGRDTCGDQLGRKFVNAAARSRIECCRNAFSALPEGPTSEGESSIICMPVRRDEETQWWPVASAACIATHLRPTERNGQHLVDAPGCAVSSEGQALAKEMGTEWFLGADVLSGTPPGCNRTIGHTLLAVRRQDQWNPFHVAEDLITTLATMFIAAAAVPDLARRRVQLVFVDNFELEKNHISSLWDRVGAWPPRRLGFDPWEPGTCYTNAIYSPRAGRSLLSATGLGKALPCASTMTWAAAHYYRHLFGLPPRSISDPAGQSSAVRPINVLWLTRRKLDAFRHKHEDTSPWTRARELENEDELVIRLRRGLSELCTSDSPFGARGCVFQDADEEPETWSRSEPRHVKEGEPVPVRFLAIDPTVHTLDSQIHALGHTTVLVSQHGGALGMSLFMHPGDGAVVELQVPAVHGNFHFQHMAAQMGHAYECVQIRRRVDVDDVWHVVRGKIEELVKEAH